VSKVRLTIDAVIDTNGKLTNKAVVSDAALLQQAAIDWLLSGGIRLIHSC
jgi:hypothetical protein